MTVMDAKTQLKFDVIVKVDQGKLSTGNAAKLLAKSRRTVERYLAAYRRDGLLSMMHKNANSAPANKTPDGVKKKIQHLIKTKYYDFNLTHLGEKLADDENIRINRETLRQFAHEINHVKRAKKRRRIIRKRRDRMASPGLLLQLDGSFHKWFGDEETCLLAVIDDADSELHAEFFPSENTAACMKLLKDVVSHKGIFQALYVDRAGLYAGPKRCNFSQVERACNELGIEIIYANSPEAKGRIERSFNTIQDRLVPELRILKIEDMEGANNYLKTEFIPNYWARKIMVKPDVKVSNYRRVGKSVRLDDIFVQKEHRRVNNDHTFSFKSVIYAIDSGLKCSAAKQTVEIVIDPFGGFKVFFAGRELGIRTITAKKDELNSLPYLKKKFDAVELADRLGNVSEASRLSGVSRGSIYRYKKLLKGKSVSEFKKDRDGRRHKNRIPRRIENRIISFSLQNPHLGEGKVAAHFREELNIDVSSGVVRKIWNRHDMRTVQLRVNGRKKFSKKRAA